MLKSNLSNLIMSNVNIEKVQDILGNTPVLRIFFKLGSQALIDYRYPTHIFIETTRACNLKCTFCSRNVEHSESGHMDFDLFKSIVDEATSFGRKNFGLHLLGEPLLYPKIVEAIQYIKKANSNHAILLTTNGYLLDDFKARKILENNVDKIVFSVFSLRSERTKTLTGSSNISKVIDNIKNMVALKKRMHSKTNIYMRFMICEENKDELQQVQSLTKDLGILLEARYTHNFSGVIENNYISNKQTDKKRYPCYHPWFSPAITWDGKIVLCCNDWNYAETLGDMRETTLASVWGGERLKQLRRYHLAEEYNKIPLCAKCNVWSLHPDIFFGIQKKHKLK